MITSKEMKRLIAEILDERGFLPRTVPRDLLNDAVRECLVDQRGENIFDPSHFASRVVKEMLFGHPAVNRYRRAPVGDHYWSLKDKDLSPKKEVAPGCFPFQQHPRRFRYWQNRNGLYAVETLPGGRFEVYRVSSGEVRQLCLELKFNPRSPSKVTHVMWLEKVAAHPQDGCRAVFQMLPDAGRWRFFTPPNPELFENYLGGLNASEGLMYFNRWLLLAEQVHGSQSAAALRPVHLNLFYDDRLSVAEVEEEVRAVMKTRAFDGWCF